MEDRDVHFNGAGEPNLPRIEQAWSIAHLDPRIRRSNEDTLKGIAGILQDYPTLECVVHGETGAANSAPISLARHLRLDPERDVRAWCASSAVWSCCPCARAPLVH